ncbi:pre-mRNA-processing factor 39-2 isoform X2 [Gastrolobium bilobum]|uniref:pre-mRNA-processing factor 39-2 isoform X2 n=1 Tax=Gastrolobium bilobum TaxID=150636 RepID=UPI002AAF8E64|nr:pre-mRNA-processing factor 39-2 isoform X2 [Gastrolobium bilobum]
MAALCHTQFSASYDNLELQEVISKGSLDFDEWTLLISEIEKIYSDDVEKICLVYDNFLSKFPLCYGYWRKYAAHMACLCTAEKVVEVFEQAVLAATYSVGMWVDYCSFGMSAFEDPSDIRRLFKRAISFVGKDFLCHTLWDKYIHFEFSQQQWISLADIYIQTLKFPTKKLHQYYDSFKKLLSFLEEGMGSLDNSPKELQSEPCFDGEMPMTMCCEDDKIDCIIKDMMDSSVGLTSSIALKKYKIIGEQLYHNACELYSKISSFEANIQRYYFHVRPLDANQLQNWHDYLDFIELQKDFDWAVKLYERCLIVCANYPEYWMRYVDFMEAKGGREIANYSLDRATEIYLKRVPAIHLFNARFKEQIGDVLAARAAYIQSGKETDSDFVENVISKANMEKRLGNMESAFSIYKEALQMAAAQEKLHALPILYVHFSRLKYMSTNNVDAARDVLVDGIRTLPQNKLLLEELIKLLMVHGGPKHMAVIDSIIADAISPRSDGSQSLSAEDAEDISNSYLEFVDYCGTIHDVRKDKREVIFVAMPNQASRDSSSDSHAHLPQQDKKGSLMKYCDTQSDATNDGLMLMENHITQSDDTGTYRLQIRESDDNAKDKGRELPLPVSEEPRDNDPENNVPSSDLVQVKEESIKVVKNLKKNHSESEFSSENLLLQTASGSQVSQALQASKNENAAFSEGKCELEPEELEPPSLRSMSLNPHERTCPCPDSGPMTSQEERGTIPESSKSNSRAVVGGHTANQDNSASTQDSESAQIHVEINSPYSACHRDHRTKGPLVPPRFSRNSGGNWHQMRNAGKFRRGPKYGYRGYTQRKQHQRQHPSPQQIHPAEVGVQMPATPGFSSQSVLQVQQCSQGQNQFQVAATPTDFMAANSWPIQNIQIQNSLSQSQSPANTTSQVLQQAMQGNGQYGYMQNGQEYNQIWQYYYYQQQQQLQLQQHYIQLQQQSLQQEQSLQVQEQSQLECLQPQQLQQMQLQQLVLQQQQYFQQLQPQQQEHPVSLQQMQPSIQSSSHPVADQGQAIVTSQGHGTILSQQSSEPGLVSSPVLPHPQEKSTQEE